MDNMHLVIKNLQIFYENTSFYGYKSSLQIKFDELSIITTDSNYNVPKQMMTSDINYRKIDISKLSMNLKFDNNKMSSRYYSKNYNLLNSKEKILRKFQDQKYLLSPVDLEISYK